MIKLSKNSTLSKIFNRQTLKLSYRTTPYLAAVISSHNNKLLNPKPIEVDLCNCRVGKICPLDGKCLVKNVVYRAEVITDKGNESYIGLTGTTFKERWRNHMADIKKPDNKPCQLVKYIKILREKISITI